MALKDWKKIKKGSILITAAYGWKKGNMRIFINECFEYCGGYKWDIFVYGSSLPFEGGIKSTHTKSAALKFAKSWMRKH